MNTLSFFWNQNSGTGSTYGFDNELGESVDHQSMKRNRAQQPYGSHVSHEEANTDQRLSPLLFLTHTCCNSGVCFLSALAQRVRIDIAAEYSIRLRSVRSDLPDTFLAIQLVRTQNFLSPSHSRSFLPSLLFPWCCRLDRWCSHSLAHCCE